MNPAQGVEVGRSFGQEAEGVDPEQPHAFQAVGENYSCEICSNTIRAYVHEMFVDENMPLPTELTVGTDMTSLTNQYIAARNQRLGYDKKSAELHKHEVLLRQAVIAKVRETGQTASSTPLGVVKIKAHQEPKATNWPEVWQYIKENDAFDLLHKSLTVTAIRDRVAEGITIPGIEFTEVWKATVSKPE